MAKFILDGQEYCGGGGSNQIVKLTQAEYDALSDEKLSNNTIYLITDSGELTAENLFYDGSQTGLGNNVQEAIDNQNKNKTGFPNYNDFLCPYNSKNDIENSSYTVEEDGYILGRSNTAKETGGLPFVRIWINEHVVFQGHGRESVYSYLCSPLLPVKKGDVVKYTLASGTTDSEKQLYFYKLR